MSNSTDVPLKEVYHQLISGAHILHYHHVLDAFGHLSARNPSNPSTFIMPRSIAPGTIRSPQDLVEYHISDASPLDPNAPKGYLERCIHSEIYKRFPHVQAICHSHSEAVVPYSISGVPLQPCYHVAGFLGLQTPIFDQAKYYAADDPAQNMLIRNTRFGAALASYFSSAPEDNGTSVEHNVVLMRGHGFTVVAEGIVECVVRAVYTQQNAGIQTTALLTRAAYGLITPGAEKKLPEIRYLNAAETTASEMITQSAGTALRPWGLWLREVEKEELYVNEA